VKDRTQTSTFESSGNELARMSRTNCSARFAVSVSPRASGTRMMNSEIAILPDGDECAATGWINLTRRRRGPSHYLPAEAVTPSFFILLRKVFG